MTTDVISKSSIFFLLILMCTSREWSNVYPGKNQGALLHGSSFLTDHRTGTVSVLGPVSHQLRIRKDRDSSEEIRCILGQESGFGKKSLEIKSTILYELNAKGCAGNPRKFWSSEVVPTGTESSRPSIVFVPSDAGSILLSISNKPWTVFGYTLRLRPPFFKREGTKEKEKNKNANPYDKHQSTYFSVL